MSRNSIQQVHIGKRSNVVNAGILIDKLDRMFTSGTSALTGNEEEIEAELMETPEGHRRDVAAALQRQGEPLGGAGDVGGRQRRRVADRVADQPLHLIEQRRRRQRRGVVARQRHGGLRRRRGGAPQAVLALAPVGGQIRLEKTCTHRRNHFRHTQRWRKDGGQQQRKPRKSSGSGSVGRVEGNRC